MGCKVIVCLYYSTTAVLMFVLADIHIEKTKLFVRRVLKVLVFVK